MQITRLALAACIGFSATMAHSAPITFKARSQALSATSGGKYQSVEADVTWEAGKTAVIVVDMWDDHCHYFFGWILVAFSFAAFWGMESNAF